MFLPSIATVVTSTCTWNSFWIRYKTENILGVRTGVGIQIAPFQLSLFSSSLLSPKSYFYWIAVGLPRSQASVSEMQRQLTSLLANAFMAALHFSILTQPCPSKLNEPLAMTR